jgi:hypothetical protein
MEDDERGGELMVFALSFLAAAFWDYALRNTVAKHRRDQKISVEVPSGTKQYVRFYTAIVSINIAINECEVLNSNKKF